MRMLGFMLTAGLSATNVAFYIADGHHWWSLAAAVFSGFAAMYMAISLAVDP